ncbi:helix-turn-helix transcriptional regulator [Butyrivibrio sp. INlla16]|uniref:helix-turn-helix domain-containing protein n=1 Tax=Butyrivibrio sp. INlla16 TaxID=1520807 RepID=UPI000886B3C5|nr:helix-turn-helix transcriptional regulator [Butyrivibrio sp. INlla16]SDB69824.1 hypothetical protein SAMN02910263_04537 [Butyrivibrio sp. INlla16]
METKELIKQAREKGITIKSLAEMTDINARTLYNYSCGYRNLSKEKEEKIRNILSCLLE